MFWKDTDIPCTIVGTPLTVKLRPGLDEDGLRFDVLLQRGDKKPFCISEEDSEITFHGQMPLWVCWNQSFYPVQTSLSPSLVKQLVATRPVVPQDSISEFLDRVWARLPASELYEPDEFLKIMGPIFQPATYDPKLFLDEEGSLLTLEVQNTYETVHGEFILPGPNPDFQTGSYVFEGHTFLVRRDQTEEAALMAQLAEMHFQPRSNKLWFMEPEEAIAFLLDSYPTLVENWRVYGEKALTRYKVRMSQPIISAKVESNEKEKWFSLDIDVEYDGQHLPLERIWKAWVRGRRYVQLKDGSYTSLPESWLEKLAHKLQAPVCDSLMGKGAFSGEDALYTGMLGMHGTKTANFGVSHCDLLITIGARFSDRVIGNAARFAQKKLEIALALENDSLLLSVADDGPGFPDELLKNGPKPFGRLEENSEHFGMGLYSSSLLCRKHGGNLRLENRPAGAITTASIQINFKP